MKVRLYRCRPICTRTQIVEFEIPEILPFLRYHYLGYGMDWYVYIKSGDYLKLNEITDCKLIDKKMFAM